MPSIANNYMVKCEVILKLNFKRNAQEQIKYIDIYKLILISHAHENHVLEQRNMDI